MGSRAGGSGISIGSDGIARIHITITAKSSAEITPQTFLQKAFAPEFAHYYMMGGAAVGALQGIIIGIPVFGIPGSIAGGVVGGMLGGAQGGLFWMTGNQIANEGWRGILPPYISEFWK